MSHIQSILVPVDFSDASQRALASARELAATSGATIHLLHVFETPLAMGAFMDMYTPAPDDYIESLGTQARAQLEALLTETEKTSGMAVVAVRMGMPADQILQYAREHGAIDLIVIATSGRGRVARLVMGSVADAIVRSAPCPVLTVHPHDRDEATEGGRAA
jgi:nucleotide-binding universal stress UspA family protein